MPGIIVDGAEQTGKSTFCRRLAEKLGYELVHMHKGYGFVDGVFDYVSGYFYDIDRNPDLSFVYDRNYLSELAYGGMFERGNITPEVQARIEQRFAQLGYVVVLCHYDGGWIDREETITREQNELVAKHFESAYNSVTLPKIKVCPRRDQDALAKVIELLERSKRG